MKKQLLLLVMMLLSMVASAYNVEIDGICYELWDYEKTAMVTYQSWDSDDGGSSSGYSGAITIPSSISYQGKTYSVTRIGSEAFRHSRVTSVDIPNSVTYIEYSAFESSGITSVTLPNSVISIVSAFYDCPNLKTVYITSIESWLSCSLSGTTSSPFYNGADLYIDNKKVTTLSLPAGTTSIPDYAFYGCKSITSITIPSTVNDIGTGAFANCSSLTAINVNSGNSNYSSLNGLLYDANKTELILCPKSKSGTLNLPSSVTSIKDYACYECSNLSSVTMPDKVTNIGIAAFSGCKNISSITLPSSLTSIGPSAFAHCEGLKSINLPNSLMSIGNYAFCYCLRLTSVNLPHSLKSIGDGAFYGCNNLVSITLFSSLSNGGDDTFTNCLTIKTVNVIIDDISSISENHSHYASLPTSATWNYYINDNLVTELNIPKSVTSIGHYAFCNAKSLTSISLPNTLTSIGYCAFYNCSGLTSITLPNSLTSIESSAFENCSGMTSITLPNSLKSVEYNLFAGCSKIATVNVNITDVSNISEDHLQYSFLPASATWNYMLNDNIVTAINIPSSVKRIGDNAFYNAKGFSSITLPNTVISIGNCAFYNCSGLSSLTLPASLSSIGNYAFSGCKPTAFICKATTPPTLGSGNGFGGKKKIYVPFASIDAYKIKWSQLAEPTYTYLPLLDVMFFEMQTAESYAAELSGKNKDGITSVAFYEGGIDETMTENVLKKGMNPNCLYYMPTSAGLSGDNIVSLDNYEAKSVTLTDNYTYECPIPFHTEEIKYVHNPSVWANGSAGWETICLPFAPHTFKASERGYISPIMLGSTGNFWLRKFVGASSDAVHFSSTIDGVMEANTPYIVAFPGSTMGTGHLQGQTITFIGSNADIEVTQQHEVKKNDFAFVGNYDSAADGIEGWALNAAGSSFVKSSNVGNQPFRAYFKNEAGVASSPALRISFGEPTDIRSLNADVSDFMVNALQDGTIVVLSDSNRSINIYGIDGRLVRRIQLSAGENRIDGLSRGLYIIENQKVNVR